MLYFSESGWTLPDMMAVSAEFDQGYSQGKYENKVARIVRHIRGSKADRARWNDAVRCLRREDHYLLVLIGGAYRLRTSRAPGDILRLILTACVIIAVMLSLMFVLDSHVMDMGLRKLMRYVTFFILIAGVMFLYQRKSR